MNYILNGESQTIKEEVDIYELLENFNIDGKSCIVLMDDEIIPKNEYSKKIYENANIEILRFVSGG
ncbi:MAG: sulfur carrier protein ThiS [Fusobacteriaceae bacterium]|mgnify:CR=1 FL=1|jgi:thiamine biosynthesis protein ThiS|nr:sulfur carrier protein ThiS [Fusobacteriaceae bacterium]MBP6322570.1 sulfur carrier protein ThiS [Fusobacteriaceae bacterium]MBP9509517.1 sulfur carrier protein ThiS [Fusobacteriaceae bacterium]